MRYVVTGAAGFIGSQLAETLLGAGHEVTGIDCFTDFYDTAVKEKNAAEIDVRRIDLAEDPLDFSGFDGVFHLAGRGGARAFAADFPLYLRENVQASQRVFEAAARAGVRVVFASSSTVYGAAERCPTTEETVPAPRSPYGMTKLAGEQLARAYSSLGLDIVVLRYFSVFGPRQRPDMAFARVAHALAEGRSFELYGDGSQTRSWTYVDDVVAATIAAMRRGTGTYNVGGEREVPLRDAIALLEQLAGRSLDVRVAPALCPEPNRTGADTSRIRRELGWTPRTPLERGLEAQWDWTVAKRQRARSSPGGITSSARTRSSRRGPLRVGAARDLAG